MNAIGVFEGAESNKINFIVVVVVEVLSICCGHGETGETPFHIPPVATFNRDERNKESISRSTHGKMEHQSGTWKNQLN